jgi:hypothetical protein
MPWQWKWNPSITCYTGLEYKEVLRKKYNLPDDWEPEPPVVKKWRRSDFVDQDNPAFFEGMERDGYLEPEEEGS